MNKHPHVYKTFVRAYVLRTLCFALLLGSFALTAKAGPTTAPSFSPPSTISGKVTDSKNAPLEGASITIKGSKRGTTTNAAGAFTLQNVPDNAVLVFSFSGYKNTGTACQGQNQF
ncbi:MAG TPA: carboxypeptidase-like regulatory domain-containing protein [Sediminibacterium sp.]|nr:carboxypeptidase-like regulatory domain-containing protein [Sediminibacterium sp.]